MDTIIVEKTKYQQEHYELFKWALKAIAKKPTNYLNTVWIGKNRVACTDGHRVHIFRHDRTYEPGVYDVKSVSAKSIVLQKNTIGFTYPDISRVIPRGKKEDRIFVNERECNSGSSYTQVVRKMEENLTVNYDYFDDCVTAGEWKITIIPKSNILYFRNCNKSAVIMPAVMPKV